MSNHTITARLTELGLVLPQGVRAAASYVPGVLHGETLRLSGQIPRVGSEVLYCGKVGEAVTLDQARRAAEVCTLRLLSVANDMAGSLDRLRVAELTVYVSSPPGFFDQSAVADAASELLVRLFGGQGHHARAAVGVAALPQNACVEISAVFCVST